MYEPIRGQNNEEDNDNNHNRNQVAEGDEVDESSHIITHKSKGFILPKTIKIKDPLPGEISIWKKRSIPRAMRIHKKKEDINPHRFYLSELLLYTPHKDEKELYCDDEEACRELYLKEIKNTQYVKRFLCLFHRELKRPDTM